MCFWHFIKISFIYVSLFLIYVITLVIINFLPMHVESVTIYINILSHFPLFVFGPEDGNIIKLNGNKAEKWELEGIQKGDKLKYTPKKYTRQQNIMKYNTYWVSTVFPHDIARNRNSCASYVCVYYSSLLQVQYIE